jgi:DNA topoisomerase-1
MNLLLVESPSKCKSIKGYLGKGWLVQASFGHVMDLPLKSMGITPPDFKPDYVVLNQFKKLLPDLKKMAARAETIYLATDPDREGEAIAWHLKSLLGKNNKYVRISFNEITKKAILASIEQPNNIDTNLVAAQESRRVIDRIVGYEVTPVLTKICGHRSYLSAGRVQSPALRLVVERELEIKEFVSQSYHEVIAHFPGSNQTEDNPTWTASWNFNDYLETPVKYWTKTSIADDLVSLIKKHPSFTVTNRDSEEGCQKPPAPFTTSTLQQAASVTIGLSPDKTDSLAQKLYEKGFITYHRTDSVTINDDSISEIRQWISMYAKKKGLSGLLPDKPNIFKAKNGSQEAHEAIRPTSIFNTRPEGLSEDQRVLYLMIWQRTAGSQMESCIFSITHLLLRLDTLVFNHNPVFTATGKTIISPGWKSLVQDATEESADENSAPIIPTDINEGSQIYACDIIRADKKTKAPKRYTEASLIKRLESEGIGRPSTYSTIIATIKKNDYVDLQKKILIPTNLGIGVINNLKGNFSFVDLEFTRKMELILDKVAQGDISYHSLVTRVYDIIQAEIKDASHLIKESEFTSYACPDCANGTLQRVEKVTDHNVFEWVCNQCNGTFLERNFRGNPEPDLTNGRHIDSDISDTGSVLCPKCKENELILKKGPYGPFWGCSSFPKCRGSFKDNDGVPVTE